ncbi:hypothetical protein ACTOB_004209 [Actinoplanes oblitus]|uniref:Uncharacterized protein n=1 Tax=Actinoplanes oblitus TaxID=3040509 RepID=A0ABY8WUT4_9ACTN|nr:hypothetical protein [Actinoplanes oblitus]WIN00499.1 hypothetical protein ACTOB_004209 [Actinoplanes oblitus]
MSMVKTRFAAGLLAAMIVGCSPSPVAASPDPATAAAKKCKNGLPLPGGTCIRVLPTDPIPGPAEILREAQKRIGDYVDKVGQGGRLPMPALIDALKNGRIPGIDFTGARLADCDPTTWHPVSPQLVDDIKKCGEAVQPFVAFLPGTTIDEQLDLNAAQKFVIHLAETGKGLIVPIAEVIQAWKDDIVPYADLIDTGLSSCDPSGWHDSGVELVLDIDKCRQVVQTYAEVLAGASLTEKMGLIDCVEHPEMAGDIRCDWH